MTWGALALGGLVASIVFALSFLLSRRMNLEFLDLAGTRPPAAESTTPAAWVFSMLTSSIVLGFATAWLYAAIRPRFGPGPRTAVFVGLFFSALLDGLPIALALSRGDRVFAMNVMAAGFFLLTYVVAALLAGLIYWETPESRHRRDSGRWPTSS
jgi:hypothetical protein